MNDKRKAQAISLPCKFDSYPEVEPNFNEGKQNVWSVGDDEQKRRRLQNDGNDTQNTPKAPVQIPLQTDLTPSTPDPALFTPDKSQKFETASGANPTLSFENKNFVDASENSNSNLNYNQFQSNLVDIQVVNKIISTLMALEKVIKEDPNGIFLESLIAENAQQNVTNLIEILIKSAPLQRDEYLYSISGKILHRMFDVQPIRMRITAYCTLLQQLKLNIIPEQLPTVLINQYNTIEHENKYDIIYVEPLIREKLVPLNELDKIFSKQIQIGNKIVLELVFNLIKIFVIEQKFLVLQDFYHCTEEMMRMGIKIGGKSDEVFLQLMEQQEQQQQRVVQSSSALKRKLCLNDLCSEVYDGNEENQEQLQIQSNDEQKRRCLRDYSNDNDNNQGLFCEINDEHDKDDENWALFCKNIHDDDKDDDDGHNSYGWNKEIQEQQIQSFEYEDDDDEFQIISQIEHIRESSCFLQEQLKSESESENLQSEEVSVQIISSEKRSYNFQNFETPVLEKWGVVTSSEKGTEKALAGKIRSVAPMFKDARNCRCLCLIRHGESEYNARAKKKRLGAGIKIFDAKLTDDGILQSQNILQNKILQKASEAQKIDLVDALWIVSPLSRTVQTFMHMHAQAKQYPKNVYLCPLMREKCCTWGDVGRPLTELKKEFPEFFQICSYEAEEEFWWHKPEINSGKDLHRQRLETEKKDEFQGRIDKFSRWLSARRSKLTILVGHGLFFKQFSKRDDVMENAEVLRMVW